MHGLTRVLIKQTVNPRRYQLRQTPCPNHALPITGRYVRNMCRTMEILCLRMRPAAKVHQTGPI